MALILLEPECSVTQLLTLYMVSKNLIKYKAIKLVLTNYCV